MGELTADGPTTCHVTSSARVSYRMLALGRGEGIALLTLAHLPKA